MTVETDNAFSRAIQDHLELKKQNAGLDGNMPLDRYAIEDPFENHPLFKSEEQARFEDTLVPTVSETPSAPQAVSSLPWPGENSTEGAALDEDLWGHSRDFDWGD